MNVYDFDKTIYDGDATQDFYRHCLKRYPKVFFYSLRFLWPGVKFLNGTMEKTEFKRLFFGFLTVIPDIELEVKLFWDRNGRKMKGFYLRQKRPDDLIISASPEFLLRPMLRRVGICGLIGTRVDEKTGALEGVNCYGAEKTVRFREVYPDAEIEEFYSDSLSDDTLAELAQAAYLVNGECVSAWPKG